MLSMLGAQTYTISTVAGGALPTVGLRLAASLGSVNGVAVDPNGNVYLSATDYNVVLKLNASSGAIELEAGNGISGYSGDNGPAASAQLSAPRDIAVDSAGDIFIADGRSRVRKVSSGAISTVGGLPANLYISGIAVDSAGNLYVSSLPNVLKVSAGGVVTTVAGNNTPGFSGDNGPATSAQLNNPGGLAIDSQGNLYVADSGNNRVREVSNGIITTVAGNGTPGFSGDNGPALSAELKGPQSVTLDSSGNLYIADDGNIRIRRVSNGVITTVAGTGTLGYTGDGGQAVSAEVGNLLYLASGPNNLYIADSKNDRIREIVSGVINTIAGNGTGFGGDGGAATAAQLDLPSGVAVDASGNLYIADTSNSRIREVSKGTITTFAGNGTAGHSGDGGPASSAELGYPGAVAAGSSGNVFIDDGLSLIREVSGEVITTVAGNGIYGYAGDGGPALQGEWGFSEGLAVDSHDNLYIADTGDGLIREVSSGVINTIAGSYTEGITYPPGANGYTGDNGFSVSATLSNPYGVAVDSAGNIYIADSGFNKIEKVSNGVITVVAGSPTEQAGYSGDGGPATSAQLDFPYAVALDSSGNLYISDNGNGVIRKVSGGVITTIAGGGTTLGDGGLATKAQFGAPGGLTVDGSGNVYVADYGSNRVRLLTPSGTSCNYAFGFNEFGLSAGPGGFTSTIQTAASCGWVIENLPDWITASANTGTGPTTVTLTIAANTGPARSAQVLVAGITVAVNQDAAPLQIGRGGVANAASFSLPVAPGSISAIFGDFLLTSPFTASTLPLPTSLGTLSLQFGSVAVPLFYAGNGQVNGQIPWELAGQTQATITATLNGANSLPQTVTLATYAPGIFTIDGSGTGPGAVLDSNYSLVTATNPTTAGAYIQLYCTGLGPVTNQPATGAPAPVGLLAETTTAATVVIGNSPAKVLYSGLAPGTVGLYQVNVQVPAGVTTGSAVPVMLSIGGVESNVVTMAIQ